VPSDKLPAVSGIAQIFHQVIRSSYVAGVWGLKATNRTGLDVRRTFFETSRISMPIAVVGFHWWTSKMERFWLALCCSQSVLDVW
jgi:hypothetical protein